MQFIHCQNYDFAVSDDKYVNKPLAAAAFSSSAASDTKIANDPYGAPPETFGSAQPIFTGYDDY